MEMKKNKKRNQQIYIIFPKYCKYFHLTNDLSLSDFRLGTNELNKLIKVSN